MTFSVQESFLSYASGVSASCRVLPENASLLSGSGLSLRLSVFIGEGDPVTAA